MLTFTLAGPDTVRIVAGKSTIVAFAEAPMKDALVFRAGPEETSTPGVMSWPGEYDIDDIAIRGVGHNEGARVSFTAEIDGVRCAFVAAPLPEWTDHEIELLGNVDVLVIGTDDAKKAQKLIEELDPRVLIPLPGSDAKSYAEVIKNCGATGKESVTEYKIKGQLPQEGREVVLFE